MKANLSAAAAVVIGLACCARADEASPSGGAPVKTAESGASTVVAEMPAVVPPPVVVPAPPVVRLPVPLPATTSPSAAPGMTAQLGWSGGATELRTPASLAVRTNHSWETKGTLPRLTKPERRTFGGFVVGFANLFNPFAPSSQGVGGSAGNYYDGQINAAPLPRAFRDERSHEPHWEFLVVPLESDPGGLEAKPTSVPAPAR